MVSQDMVVSPYRHGGKWYRGCVHCHSTNSDGGLSPSEVAEFYRAHGYDFLALTDHGVLTPTEEFNTPEFLCLPAEELSSPHMIALGIRETIHDQLDFAGQIEAVREQGGLPIVSHPAWMGLRVEEIAAHEGLPGIEIYNYICDSLNGKGLSLNIWDELLDRGRRLWGFAVDDAHQSERHPGADRGWIMVRAPELSADAILRSIADGCFYSSTGPTIEEIEVLSGEESAELHVRCSPCQAIILVGAAYYGHRLDPPEGELLTEATFPLSRQTKYARVECRAPDGTVAWTNPVGFE
jgi:hypothetical protein